MKTNQFIDFDVESFFDKYGINYAEGVKNVGNQWIGIETCPFCDAGNFHFAINKESKKSTCFVCGESCKPIRLIQTLLNVNWKKAYEIIKNFSTEIIEFPVRKPSKEIIFPSGVSEIDSIGRNYLKRRNYNPAQLIKDYAIKQTGPISSLQIGDLKLDFRNRIIVPIIMDHEIVSYLGRDMTGKHKNRYQNPVIEAVKITPSSAIYNIDSVKDKCIIVEGVTDCWRLGKGAISLQGVKFTSKQVLFLAEKRLNKIFVCYDTHAEKEAEKLAHALGSFCDEISVVTLPKNVKDPGELSDFEALKIKYQLIGG